jgi:putative ABC transport system permease protein
VCGADRSDIGRLVLAGSVRLAFIGIIIGIFASLGAARWIQSQLFAVSAIDPATFVGVALVVLATAVVATWHPVWHAIRIDPIVALRDE